MGLQRKSIDFNVCELDKIVSLQPPEKLEMIKAALYSDDNLLKIVIKIVWIVDPGAMQEIVEWLCANGLVSDDET